MIDTSHAFQMVGARATHPEATSFAGQSASLVERYAKEVVLAWKLCPFMTNADSALGAVVVVLDEAPTVATVTDVVMDHSVRVMHLIFPLFSAGSSPFERFGNQLAESVRSASRARGRESLVHATFHPSLTGGLENPHRLIGLLRQAPDPFIQFVPHGLMTPPEGEGPVDHPKARFQRLVDGSGVDEVLAVLTSLKAARAELAPLEARVRANA